jgi:glycine/D-amino acid oxidase-like deaminating enzyme
MIEKDYLIVGQGIAGTMIAFAAQQAYKSILVINQHQEFSASKVSAGLINPITGRKFVKSWMMDVLLPIAIETYQQLSEQLDFPFFENKNIIRAFSNNKDENNWFVRANVPSYQKYIQENTDLAAYDDVISPAFGYGEVLRGGRVQIKKLLQLFRTNLIHRQEYLEEEFDYGQLKISSEEVIYKNFKAKQVIFCEGYGIKSNPFFNYLPVQGNKGEVLIIKIPNFNAEKIIKQRVFLVPLGNEHYWVGSTYFNDFKNTKPSEKGYQTLLDKLNSVLKLPFEIIAHQAAIRPTIPDRRPIIGRHFKFKNVVLFNGMGTKGASLSPYWAKRLVECLDKNESIDDIVSIRRYDVEKVD